MSTARLVPVCSVCQRVHLRRAGRDTWVARPDLIARPASELSHGYCPRCAREALADLHRHRAAA